MKLRSLFSKFFSPRHAGLDIADQAIRYVVFTRADDGHRIVKHGTLNLPVGVLVGGTLADPKRLTRILKNLKDKTGITQVRTSFPESHRFVFEQAGMKVRGAELRAHAHARALLPKHHPHASVIVNFGEYQTDVAVVYNGVVYLAQSLPIPHNPIETVMRVFGISQLEAETAARTIGLSRKEEHAELFKILGPKAVELVHVIRGLFAEWHALEKGAQRPRIHDIILVGKNAAWAGLPEYIATSLHTDVRLGNPWMHLNTLETYVPPIHKEETPAYATAFGLAMGE